MHSVGRLLTRPCCDRHRQEFKAAFLPSESVPSLSELTGRAVSKGGLGIADELDGGVLLRSVYWRVSRRPAGTTHGVSKARRNTDIPTDPASRLTGLPLCHRHRPPANPRGVRCQAAQVPAGPRWALGRGLYAASGRGGRDSWQWGAHRGWCRRGCLGSAVAGRGGMIWLLAVLDMG